MLREEEQQEARAKIRGVTQIRSQTSLVVDLVCGLSYASAMATTVNVHEAKTHFSKLLAQVSAGEEIIIAKAGKPVARLAPIEPKAAKKRVPGIDKGKIWMSDDFDVMSDRELDEWYRVDSRLK